MEESELRKRTVESSQEQKVSDQWNDTVDLPYLICYLYDTDTSFPLQTSNKA